MGNVFIPMPRWNEIHQETKKSPKNVQNFKVRMSNVATLWGLRRQTNYAGDSGVVKNRWTSSISAPVPPLNPFKAGKSFHFARGDYSLIRDRDRDWYRVTRNVPLESIYYFSQTLSRTPESWSHVNMGWVVGPFKSQ